MVPSGLLITRLMTFLVPGAELPGAAPGAAVGAGPLADALGGAALISRVARRFRSVVTRVFRSPHGLEVETLAAVA